MSRDLLLAAVLIAAALAWLATRLDPPAAGPSALSTTALLADAPEAFERVTGPAPIEFPQDHAAHPGYRNEWWYFTGNLADADGRGYGFQFTLFRFGLAETLGPGTDFATDAAWMAHLAVSDLEAGRFHAAERFARGAQSLAGADTERWWLRDWQVLRGAEGWRLHADAGDFAIELVLDPEKPVVLQGERGYSRKGPDPGNASRYYSLTRLAARGALFVGGQTRSVAGSAWLDREWGSSQLGDGIAGWDWFALQLDDGRDLMLYRLRTDDGRASRWSAGALVAADGDYTILDAADFTLTPARWWRDADGTRWPVGWAVDVPAAGLTARVEAVFDAQRWDASVRYWEGAVDVRAAADGARIGRGYLELSGYGTEVR